MWGTQVRLPLQPYAMDCSSEDQIAFVGNAGLSIFCGASTDASQNYTCLYSNSSEYLPASGGNGYFPRLLVGVFGGPSDALVLQYTGVHSTQTTPPGINGSTRGTALLCRRGYEHTNWTRLHGYGMSTKSGSSQIHAVGTTSGWGISVEAKFDFGEAIGWHGGFGAKFEYRLRKEFSTTHPVTSSTTYATNYDSGPIGQRHHFPDHHVRPIQVPDRGGPECHVDWHQHDLSSPSHAAHL